MFQSKPVLIAIIAVILGLSALSARVVTRRHARAAARAQGASSATVAPLKPSDPAIAPAVTPSNAGQPNKLVASAPPPPLSPIAENAAYLDQYYNLEKHSNPDQDAHGVAITRRKTAATVSDAVRPADSDAGADPIAPTSVPLSVIPLRASTRLSGRTAAPSGSGSSLTNIGNTIEEKVFGGVPPSARARARSDEASDTALATARRARPQRFNPYGSVLKCELVFPLESVSEQIPLVGIVMEPVYNNGRLVIPAGTELHGVARPDRTRNRLFSGDQWVFVFPRENGRINGRQLSVRGFALERIEPDVNGLTWGLGDGAYGLEGTVIRSMSDEEIKRFVATFLSGAAAGLQTRRPNANGGDTIDSTPRNAALQGIATDMQQLANDIAAEISRHGVYIHIPAGHQFYFYPTQVIDPDVADVSSDIATVK